jgi:hypothetical protein
MKTRWVLMIFTVLFITACSKSGMGGGGGGAPLDCSMVPKSYSANVDPIIQSTCNAPGCHNAGSVNGPGPLTNYTEVRNASTLIRAAIVNRTMPKNSTLTADQRNSIICWIDSGTPQN